MLVAVAIRILRPEWDTYAGGRHGRVGLVVLYTLGQWREIVAYFRQRHARYGAIATVGVIVALAIAVAVTTWRRGRTRWDFTASRQNSLAEQTVKVVQSLDARSSSPSSTSRRSSSASAPASRHTPTRHRDLGRYIDPDMKPVEAKNAGIEQYGTVVVNYKDKTERVTVIPSRI